MTNREKLKEIFPNGLFLYKKDWLNKEYKEPTTKNDLSVEFINDNVYILGKDNEAIQEVVETIHKYQKILEILEKVWNIPSCMIDKAECLDKIMEIYKTVR